MVNVPWKSLFIASLIVGMVWPLPYFIHPGVGLFFTVMLAVAAGLFLITIPTSGDMLPFGSYLLAGFLTGTLALVMALFVLSLACQLRLLAQNHMCTARAGLAGFVIVAYGLYLFILAMLYLFMRR